MFSQVGGNEPTIPTSGAVKVVLDSAFSQVNGNEPTIPTSGVVPRIGDWFFVYPPKFTEPTYGSFYYKGQKYETFEYK